MSQMTSRESFCTELAPYLQSLSAREVPEPWRSVGILPSYWLSQLLDWIEDETVADPGPIPPLDLSQPGNLELHRDYEIVDLNIADILQTLCEGGLIEKRQLVANPITDEIEVLFTPLRFDVIYKSSKKGIIVSPNWTTEMMKVHFCKSVNANPDLFVLNNINTYKPIDKTKLASDLIDMKILTVHLQPKRRINTVSVDINNQPQDNNQYQDSSIFSVMLTLLSNLEKVKEIVNEISDNSENQYHTNFKQAVQSSETRVIMIRQIIADIENDFPQYKGMKVEEYPRILKAFIDRMESGFPQNGKLPKLDFTKSWRENWDACLSVKSSSFFKNFYGLVRSIKKCTECGRDEGNEGTFSIIQLPIAKRIMKKVTVQHCLKTYLKNKELSKATTCSRCNSPLSHEEKVEIVKFPDMFIIYLKRFIKKRKGLEKDTTSVRYDLSIDFAPYIPSKPKEAIYDLVGVVIHPGGTDNSHHRPMFYSHQQKCWLSLSNNQCVPIPQENVLNFQYAHTLVYSKRTLRRRNNA